MARLEAHGIEIRYGNLMVLHGVSLSAGPGEAVALLGPTGSGKTSLLMVLAGLLEPSRGTVLLDGKPLRGQLPAARRRIGIVFQNPADQFFNPSVYDEIAYALRTMGLDEHVVKERVLRVAERLGIEKLLDRHPSRLSGGQQRLVALASVLVYEPEILLLDEPATYLDARGVGTLLEVLGEHRRRGGTVVLATHSIDLVLEIGARAYVLRDGRLEAVLRPSDFSSRDILRRLPLHLPYSLRLLAERCPHLLGAQGEGAP